jgi:hypothetical protein
VLWTAALVGCATTPGVKLAGPPAAPPEEPDAEMRRAVHSVRLQSTSVDGQTSWIIEPDVPRIPVIAGLDAKLPPHIEQRMSRAFDLAQRGATFSASEEFRAVLGMCALELDACEGSTNRREALRQGLIALDEADQFSGNQFEWRDSTDIQRIAASHTTPVLSGGAPRSVDSIHAVQQYYAFAEERLALACGGMPGASLAFYGLGRTYVVPGARVAHATGKAALLQRVALTIAPQNVLAGNELGVLLAQHGELREAERLFQQCVAADPSPEAWQNLAIVYARQGRKDASHSALAAGEALATVRQNARPIAGTESEVDSVSAERTTDGKIASSAATPKSGESSDPDRAEGRSGVFPGFLERLGAAPTLPAFLRH